MSIPRRLANLQSHATRLLHRVQHIRSRSKSPKTSQSRSRSRSRSRSPLRHKHSTPKDLATLAQTHANDIKLTAAAATATAAAATTTTTAASQTTTSNPSALILQVPAAGLGAGQTRVWPTDPMEESKRLGHVGIQRIHNSKESEGLVGTTTTSQVDFKSCRAAILENLQLSGTVEDLQVKRQMLLEARHVCLQHFLLAQSALLCLDDLLVESQPTFDPHEFRLFVNHQAQSINPKNTEPSAC